MLISVRETLPIRSIVNNAIITRQQLDLHLRELLQPERFVDYCPNGLQVQGNREVRHVVSGVTASLALIHAARDAGADTLLVHHGYFWRGEDACVVGQKHQRLKALLAADMNLFAFHLPLDEHPTLGNNAQLALKLGLITERLAGDKELVHIGHAAQAKTAGDLCKHIAQALKREPLMIGSTNTLLGNVAWCTGAAQGSIEDAHAAGAMLYISGEISEPTAHFAREMGMVYLACGHHATERYGVQAVGEHLAQTLNIQHTFIDIDNPA
jgi:dinuclear metal center YbgI/SA1388 family protein